MKSLLIIVLFLGVFCSATAQKTNKPKSEKVTKVDTTQKPLPIGLFILYVTPEDAQVIINAMNLTDYSKSKTDPVLGRITQQMEVQQEDWKRQIEENKKGNAADSTGSKK